MLVCAWMVFPLSIQEVWWWKCCILPRTHTFSSSSESRTLAFRRTHAGRPGGQCLISSHPARDLWDLVIEVMYSSKNQPVQGHLLRDEAQKKHTNTKTKKHVNRDDFESFNVDHVTTNAKLSHFGALHYIFEDIEAVIKMMIKGEVRRWDTCPEPAEIHWLVVWQNQFGPWNPNQICRYQKPTSQTRWRRGNFARDEWNHFLRFAHHEFFFDVLLQPLQSH